jgi:dTDP-4-amino-4,6-dideoxygalactose transaminase
VGNPAIASLIGKVYDRLPPMLSTEKLNELFKVSWRFGLHRYSDPLTYWFGKLFRSKSKNRGGGHCMANLDAALALAALPKISSIHQQRYAIISYYLRELLGKQDIFLPQSLADGMPPVSRLYFGFQRCRVKLDKAGQIVQHNPLYVYLRQEGIKTFYPYLPVKRYLAQYQSFWENDSWLYSLLGLPVDYKKSPHHYQFVVNKIRSFAERYE